MQYRSNFANNSQKLGDKIKQGDCIPFTFYASNRTSPICQLEPEAKDTTIEIDNIKTSWHRHFIVGN